jgi:hyperosmotically inducible protein
MKTNIICRQKSVLVISCLSAVLVLAACEQKGPAEKAGQKIDQASEKAGQKIDQTAEKAAKELEGAKAAVIEKADSAGEYMDDSMITAKVKEALITDDLLKAVQIEVTTLNGVVKLSGTLNSEQLVSRAVDLVKSQKNVKSVQNDLLFNADLVAK